ncbi:Uncharacterized membrane protein [Clostridium cavendishii DSM 21758]|uniref:Uncharacterized membrane protein n=1 Tax=Clostridium cavendishii DSM 21758 TaxID=1121302 RepID=A0A1M6J601_9CLOT|nr:DUF1700 domain-containing protein [Clostridium cavendishii]SHJ42067.1 Uncharacterized membrane protein [Clostridium cavendishii DSM 21758]
MDKNSYIKELTKNLSSLPKEEKEDVLREIEQNINDALAAGENEADILYRLGNPKMLAKAYMGDYYIKQNKFLKCIPFFIFTGFSSLFIVPFCGALAFGFGIGSIALIIGGILRTLGATWITMLWYNEPLPQSLSLLYAIPLAIIFFLIAYLNFKLLKAYFKRISASYKRRTMFN